MQIIKNAVLRMKVYCEQILQKGSSSYYSN